MQRIADHIDVGVLQHKHAQRHAREEIHVKRVHHFQPATQLRLAALKDEQVAQGVHIDDGFARRNGRQNLGHFPGGNEVQRHDDGARTGQVFETRRPDNRARADGHRAFGDVVNACVVAHDGKVVRQQNRIEHVEHLAARQRLAGAQADYGVAPGVHGVIELEQITQQGGRQIADGGIFEIEGNLFAFGQHRVGFGANITLEELIVPRKNARFGFGFCLILGFRDEWLRRARRQRRLHRHGLGHDVGGRHRSLGACKLGRKRVWRRLRTGTACGQQSQKKKRRPKCHGQELRICGVRGLLSRWHPGPALGLGRLGLRARCVLQEALHALLIGRHKDCLASVKRFDSPGLGIGA